MKRYPFFAPLWLGWNPGDLYRDLARNGRGVGVLWLLFLTFCSTVVFTILLVVALNQLRATTVPPLLAQIPDLHITDGVFSTPGNESVEVVGPDHKTIIAALLPADDRVPAQYASTPVVVLRNRLVIRQSDTESRDFAFEPKMNLELTQDQLRSGVDEVLALAPYVVAPFVLVAWFLWRLVVWLLLSLVAFIVNNTAGAGLPYAALLRIVSAAMTPTILLALLLSLFGIAVSFEGVFFFVVTAVLVALAVRAALQVPPLIDPSAASPPPP